MAKYHTSGYNGKITVLGGWVFFTTRRFLLDLDIDAPKVVIPTEFYPDGRHQCKLFLDLGHFKIMTVPVYFLRLSLSLPPSSPLFFWALSMIGLGKR
jgi:hypothetical protein